MPRRSTGDGRRPKTFTIHDVLDEALTSRYRTFISCNGESPLTTDMGGSRYFAAVQLAETLIQGRPLGSSDQLREVFLAELAHRQLIAPVFLRAAQLDTPNLAGNSFRELREFNATHPLVGRETNTDMPKY